MQTPKSFFPALIAAALLLGGCAGKTAPSASGVISDPLEPYNRAMYSFNRGVDRALLRPAARAYRFIVPPPARRGVGNFFDNLGMPNTILNDMLQLKFGAAARDTGRFLTNSTLGVLGIFDVARHWGMPDNEEDLGQTLGHWGVPSGPYLVLPFLPPTNFRDFGAFAIDKAAIEDEMKRADLVYILNDNREVRWEDEAGMQALDIVESRARRLRLDKTLALQTDEYVFVRELLMRNRIAEIGDRDEEDGDGDDEFLDDVLDDDD